MKRVSYLQRDVGTLYKCIYTIEKCHFISEYDLRYNETMATIVIDVDILIRIIKNNVKKNDFFLNK